jgi:serine/threonine kinase PknH
MSGAPGSRVGSMFGPYRLIRPLGQGGMGEVYEAEHTGKGWTVALKLMSEAVSSDPVFRERMKREARITGRLQEPHVVPIHDYGEVDGQLFLEMRLIDGTDLDTLLKRSGPLTPPRAVAIITQVAAALDAAHAAGVMHRDIKPQNVLVTRDDFAYLVDFGIASATTDEKLTQLGFAVGTWKYMAPERFSNKEIDHRADVYALGCVLYECLTGSPPYASDSAGVLISAHLMDPIPQPSTKRSGIPRALDTVITRGMAKNPDDRYASTGDLARAATQALTNPDQNRAATILRRSEELTLPGQSMKYQQPQRPPAPHPPELRPQTPQRPPPIGQTARPPANTAGPPPTGPSPRPPANTAGPALNRPAPPYQQGGTSWAGPPPVTPQPFPATWNQPEPPRNRNPWPIVAAVIAGLVVLLLIVIGIAIANRASENSGQRSQSFTTATTFTTAPTPRLG